MRCRDRIITLTAAAVGVLALAGAPAVAETENGLRLEIDGRVVIDGLGRGEARSGRASLVAGRKVPIQVDYFQDGDPSYLRLYWSWASQERVPVDPAALSYDAEDETRVMEALPEDYWPPDEAPLRATAEGSEWLDLSYQDGRLAPVVGLENRQVFRANRLGDAEPYDYATAMRVFPESPGVEVGFRLLPRRADTGRLEVEVLARAGQRPVRIALADTGWIQAQSGEDTVDLQRYEAGKWLSFELTVRSGEGTYDLTIDGRGVLEDAAFAEPADSVERLCFRTGAYRRMGSGLGLDRAEEDEVAPDRPRAGERVPEAVFFVDDVSIAATR